MRTVSYKMNVKLFVQNTEPTNACEDHVKSEGGRKKEEDDSEGESCNNHNMQSIFSIFNPSF